MIKSKKSIVTILLFCFIILTFGIYPGTFSNAAALPNRMCIDEPTSFVNKSLDINIRGWALNSSGIKEIKLYVDGKYLASTNIGQYRPDVNKVFPGYASGDNSGFFYKIPKGSLAPGIHQVKVEVYGKDGSSQSDGKSFEVGALPTIGNIDQPEPKSAFNNGLKVRGWLLMDSGVKEIKVYEDGMLKGTASIQQRQDVEAAFPEYPDGINSGFVMIIPGNEVTAGKHIIKVEAFGNDGSSYTMTRQTDTQLLQPQMVIDEPTAGQVLGNNNFNIRGWALNGSGVKEVKVYLNDVLMGNAEIGLSRPDVQRAFPNYSGADISGYQFGININKIKSGNYNVKVEAVGNDGTIQAVSKNIVIIKPEQRMNIDQPVSSMVYMNQDILVRGWALNASGVKEVRIYFNDVFMGSAEIGLSRPDVQRAFPAYSEAEKSGYQLGVNINTVKPGNCNVKVEAIGNDNTIQTISKDIVINKQQPLMNIDQPAGSLIYTTQDMLIRGWALNASGVKEVKIYIDGNYVANAEIGLSRPDVDAAVPGYINGAESGYSYTLPINMITEGNHVIRVEADGFDGTSQYMDKSFSLRKELAPRGNIDSPAQDMNVSAANTELKVRGWALNQEGVTAVKLYIDDIYMADAALGESRPDVAKAFPEYIGADTSGYNGSLDISKLPLGKHTFTVKVFNKNNDVDVYQTSFHKGMTIVIDAGHNYGGDDGAYSVIDGVSYVERDLNLQVALKLQKSLENLGFSVIMTRKEDDVLYESQLDSLKRRVAIANNSNADLFISIHHDASDSSSASGISTHYSSWRPNIDTSGTVVIGDITYDTTPCQAAIESGKLADNLADNLAALGYVNRGSRDHNLYVTRNTNMTSVLIELGFITNKGDALKAADPNEQQKTADVIANTIKSFYE